MSQDLSLLRDSFPHVAALELCAPVLDLQAAIRRLRSLPDLPPDPLLASSPALGAQEEAQEGAQAGTEGEAEGVTQQGTGGGMLQTGAKRRGQDKGGPVPDPSASTEGMNPRARQKAGLKDISKVHMLRPLGQHHTLR